MDAPVGPHAHQRCRRRRHRSERRPHERLGLLHVRRGGRQLQHGPVHALVADLRRVRGRGALPLPHVRLEHGHAAARGDDGRRELDDDLDEIGRPGQQLAGRDREHRDGERDPNAVGRDHGNGLHERHGDRRRGHPERGEFERRLYRADVFSDNVADSDGGTQLRSYFGVHSLGICKRQCYARGRCRVSRRELDRKRDRHDHDCELAAQLID